MTGETAGEEDGGEAQSPPATARSAVPANVVAEEDLTHTEQGAPARPLAPPLTDKPTLIDWTRLVLAGGLVALLIVLTIGAGVYVATYPSKEPAVESFLKLVFTPIVGLVGSVVGFYFGAHSGTKSSGS